MQLLRQFPIVNRVLVLWVVLIFYGSLFPWQFHARSLPGDLLAAIVQSWPRQLERFVIRDAFVNVALYLPLGLFGWMALQRAGRMSLSFTAPLVCGVLISSLVETLQYFTATRTSSLMDVALNTSGTAAGIAIGGLLHHRLRHLETQLGVAEARGLSTSLLLLVVWIAYQVVPLFPALSRTKLRAKLVLLVWPPSWADTFVACAEWLAIACLLEDVVGLRRQTAWLAALLLLLPARLFVEGRVVSTGELVGGSLALVLWWLVLRHVTLRAQVIAAALLVAIVVAGLAPFRFAETATAFSWIPFGGSLTAETDAGLQVLLRKIAVYGFAVWLLRSSGLTLRVAAVVVAALLGVIEASQAFLPGRTAEITDPVLALITAYALSATDGPRDRRSP
jgi:VanZ family protein